jgi:hypothetical protein
MDGSEDDKSTKRPPVQDPTYPTGRGTEDGDTRRDENRDRATARGGG